MHCKSLWIKASAKCINVNVVTYANLLRGRLCSELKSSNWNWTNQRWAKWHIADTQKSIPKFLFLQIKKCLAKTKIVVLSFDLYYY